MEDTLKDNSRSAEKPSTEADLNESLQMREVVALLQHGLVNGRKLMWLQLFFTAALMIVLQAVLFLVLAKTPFTGNVAAPDHKVAEKIMPAPEATVPANIHENQPSTAILGEWQEIQGILEQLRKAQLEKDIDLFFNAYSSTFPNLSEKKESLLKSWQKYNYLDMNFNIENIQKKDANTILVEVTCDITLEDVRSKKKSNLSNDYNIYFSNASGKWLIQGLIEGKKATRGSRLGANKKLL